MTAFMAAISSLVLLCGLVLLGPQEEIKTLREKKQKHVWCAQTLDALWKYKDVAYVGGRVKALVMRRPPPETDDPKGKFPEISFGGCDEEKENEGGRNEPILLIAAKNGVLEMVKKILEDEPGAIHETNSLAQNVLHVTVENKQHDVFEHLEEYLKDKMLWKSHVGRADKDGNTVLHLAAKLSHCKPLHIGGSAMQMQWELKWLLYMQKKVPRHLQFLCNRRGETPEEIFERDHKNLIKEGVEWLKSTSGSCSVVAALIASVAFTASITIPGGAENVTGKPYLEHHPAFKLFSLTSLLAFSCSITFLIFFLSILFSQQQPRDFHKDLPFKLLLGLSFLFMSIVSISASFSAAFFFLLKDILKQHVYSLYVFTILSIYFTVIILLPICTDLFIAVFNNTPRSSNRESGKLLI
ncbi:ankyrin repeat-containing protein ITN1-like isoform X2 [Prosopis cineraria]|uniref:ankyrin repeat-containing protein ITN1-like isoform X2 n=1 Tax=Prosopis cineraria TaxID=364024 RepID=UPI0024104758|nr:ankyrin repeat-containing protein ITN1-like isoform X2 [Prosopis cineraria]